MCGSRARLRFAGRSRSRAKWKLWLLIWIWSWDPLKLCDVIRRTTSAPPRQNPAGRDPKRAFATSKSRQQRSDQTRKPDKSEQDNCSFDSNHAAYARFEPVERKLAPLL